MWGAGRDLSDFEVKLSRVTRVGQGKIEDGLAITALLSP
jgi:hypothetical protein